MDVPIIGYLMDDDYMLDIPDLIVEVAVDVAVDGLFNNAVEISPLDFLIALEEHEGSL
jgi:hypothetical protein